MKVTTDGCLFGAWMADKIKNEKIIINNCLDIGTGTGLLTLMLAQKTNANIDTIEMDEAAAEQAIENTETSPWKERITVINANAGNYSFSKKYNTIVELLGITASKRGNTASDHQLSELIRETGYKRLLSQLS